MEVQRGEKAFGVSGKVWRWSVADGMDSPLELYCGVVVELSSDRRPSGRGGGGPVARWGAI